MTKIVLPPLPKHVIYPWEVRARDLEVARVALEAAAKFCDVVAVDVDATREERRKFLTSNGVAIYEGMYGGAINCAAGIRALVVSHE